MEAIDSARPSACLQQMGVRDALCARRRLGRVGYLIALLAGRARGTAGWQVRQEWAPLTALLRVRSTTRRS